MSDSDTVSLRRPGTWPRRARLALEATALREANVTVVFVRAGVDTSTHMGQFFRNICASVAQFEGKLIYGRMSKAEQSSLVYVGRCSYVGSIPSSDEESRTASQS